ncbi:hypothetical protein ANCCEY_07927 [Ancylostoma ceylanicum]|uniref:Phosphate transporter family protein n=1 Tax=Ancylostoma ceylanicum TaxID=53326 RepID=A0A0D6LLL0_9BILA|nr:hypothetical protein ANCCEY_07927 [Ancylostoma ceylanicum]
MHLYLFNLIYGATSSITAMDSPSVLTTEAVMTTTEIFAHGSLLWIVVVGVLLAFFLGVRMGANDVSNAFGTSVGSGVLTIVQAYVLATIFEEKS